MPPTTVLLLYSARPPPKVIVPPQRGLLSIAVLVVASCRVEAGCIDPASLAHSTVSIARYFDDKEREVEPGLLGVRGTGWFLSPTSMATIEHVAVAMNLSDQSWKQVEVRTGDHRQSIPIRIRQPLRSTRRRSSRTRSSGSSPGTTTSGASRTAWRTRPSRWASSANHRWRSERRNAGPRPAHLRESKNAPVR